MKEIAVLHSNAFEKATTVYCLADTSRVFCVRCFLADEQIDLSVMYDVGRKGKRFFF